MNLTKEQRIARHKSFMNANWRQLAGFAWQGYMNKGRGVVMVPETDFVHAEGAQLAGIRFHYAAATGPELVKLPDWAGSKEDGWLTTYDPAEKVIVLILRDGGGTSGYLIGARPPPPECHELSKAGQN